MNPRANASRLMLILTRKVGESLVIGDDVRVTIVGVKQSQVRIAVKAPREIPVHREEIYRRIKAEKAQEAQEAQEVQLNATGG